MADAMEAVWQDMDEEAADELVGGQPHDRSPVALSDAVVFPAKGDGLGVSADQAGVGNGDAMGVAAEVSQNSLGAAEGRALHA